MKEFCKPATTSERRGWNRNKGHSLIGDPSLDQFDFETKIKCKSLLSLHIFHPLIPNIAKIFVQSANYISLK